MTKQIFKYLTLKGNDNNDIMIEGIYFFMIIYVILLLYLLLLLDFYIEHESAFLSLFLSTA